MNAEPTALDAPTSPAPLPSTPNRNGC